MQFGPLFGLSIIEDDMQILKDGIPMPSRQAMSGELRDFLERCLCKDPYERADAEELLHHPFITQEARYRPINLAYVMDL